MNLHRNARTCPRSRLLIAQRRLSGWPVSAVASAHGVSEKTVRKWSRRYETEGPDGLVDRPSRPLRSPRLTEASVTERVVQLREHRLTGPAIASHLRLPRSTVGAILRRAGLSRLRPQAPDEPVRRYEWRRPGELIHLDIKKLSRFTKPGHRATGTRIGTHRSYGAGWDFIHVCIDDHSRLAYVEVLPDEKKGSAVGFLTRAKAWLAGHGVHVERVMTDNGSCYRSNDFRKLVAAGGAKHIFTKPYTPQTNGKAERFIQTLLREWAYGRVYRSSAERNERLWDWLNYYNHQRLHGGIGHKPPITRIDSSNRNNVPGHDI